MEIPSVHSANETSQYKQGCNKGINCDDEQYQRRSPSYKTLHHRHHDRTLCALKTIFGILLIANIFALSNACPSVCSCSVANTAFCNNKDLNATPLRFTSTVEKLYLFNNNITRILPRTLQPMKNLRLLDLSGNRITNYALWEGVFSQLKQLENLMLQENQITKIDKGLFKGLTNLARIYLQDNKISVIEEGAFDNLPNLVELKLKNNRITSFPRLRQTPNLLLLDLGYNRLSTIRDMALSTVNLEYLKLQGNRLTQLRTSVFDDTSRLTQLDISNNRLTAVPKVIKSLTSLRSLNMSLNNVGSIPADTFRGMTRLKLLDLHSMGLRNLPFGIIPPRVILNILDITDNNWECGCESHWLPQYIRIFEAAFVQPDEIKCATGSKLAGRLIKDLTDDDFECTEEEKAVTLLPTTISTTTTRPSSTKQPWTVNPCDVYPCFNGGTCYVSAHIPKCRCVRDWAGSQCQVSLTTSRATLSTTTKLTTTTPPIKNPEEPRLLINEDSITKNSVEIILPQTETELVVSVSEIGNQDTKEIKIKPMAHPFTVIGLEAGKSYNICIHLPMGERKDNLPPYTDNTDTLCGSVRTEGIRVINKPLEPTKIQVVPSPGVDVNGESPTEKDDGPKSDVKPGTGDQYYGENPETSPTDGSDFKVIYPAVGAGVGAIIIIVLLVMFFVCYRKKRRQKLKNQSSADYIPGSPVDNTQVVDLEMATVVHHHHHNHYNAGGLEQNKAADGKKQNGKPKQKNQHPNSFINNNSAPKTVTPNKTSSLGRSSNSSSSNSGTLQSRYVDTPQRYSQNYISPSPPNHQAYELMPPQRNGRGNEYIYRNHQNNNNSAIPLQNNQCMPMGHRYEPEIIDDMQPLVGNVNQYSYRPTDVPIYPESYPINPHNEYIPPSGPSYPPGNSRSAFQPIQSPRKNTVRTPTSESGPITTHVNTAHVMPTSTCLNRNLITDNMRRYPEGVPVV